MSLSKAELACENILQTLKKSRLTFSVQETPFSAYVTIRKKFSQKPQNSPLFGDPKSLNTCESFEMLTQENISFKLKLTESENMKKDLIVENKRLAEVVEKQNSDIERISQKIKTYNSQTNLQNNLSDVKKENERLKIELEALEISLKSVNKSLKLKDKVIYDVEKDKVKVTEDLKLVKAELADFKARVIKRINKLKREIKRIKRKDFLET